MKHAAISSASCAGGRKDLPPDLSIVIPTHNRSDLLRACLNAVVQHCPPATQVIVVDDGSAGRAGSLVAAGFPGIEIVRLHRQQGFCAAANAGIARAEAPVIEMLNDDTEVTAGWADAALALFRNQAVGAVAPLVLRWPDGRWIDSAGDRYYLGGVAGKRGHGEPLGQGYLSSKRVFGASASSAFYRRDALARVGAFSESFGAYFEDVDLSFRLNRAGYRVVYEPASRILHHVSASHGLADRRLLERQSCNEERVFWRNLPGGSLCRALPRHIAVVAAKAWRRWHEGTLIPFLCGRLRALSGFMSLLRHRRCLRRLGPAAPVDTWEVEPSFWKKANWPSRGASCAPVS
jgi:GT2 family glycosyltransferase